MIAVVLGLFGLFAILTFSLRAVLMSGVYGVIPVELPVVSSPLKDPGPFHYREQPREQLGRTTPAVVLTTDAFFFGDLAAFSTDFADPKGKFMIRHVDGEPQLDGLIATMERWLADRARTANLPMGDVVVLIPAGDIPMPIVIQVIAGLRRSPHFARVILGSALI